VITKKDLKPENILVGVEDSRILDNVNKDESVEPSPRKIYDNRMVYLSRNDFGHPKSVKRPQITDFGNATRGDVPYHLMHSIQPNPYRAPEVTLGAPWTYSTDIWNLGVMVCQTIKL
jgi:serine/threonine-protein kinase SRPK3